MYYVIFNYRHFICSTHPISKSEDQDVKYQPETQNKNSQHEISPRGYCPDGAIEVKYEFLSLTFMNISCIDELTQWFVATLKMS